MPHQDLIERSRLAPSLKLSFGFLESKSARFFFQAIRPENTTQVHPLPSVNATFNGDIATCQTNHLPLVPDGLAYYRVIVSAETHGRVSQSDTIYRIWPAYIDVELVPVDGAGTPQPMAAINFDSHQTGAWVNRQTNAVTGVLRVSPLQTRTITVRVPGPPIIKRWVTGSATVGRLRKAEVQTTFEAGFLTPRSDQKIKQLVNRTTADHGRDGKGHKITIEVGGKGDHALANPNRTALVDAYVYIKCTFSKTTARSDFAPKLTNALDIQSTNGGKTQTGRVKLTGVTKSATFKVDLGVVGGETCKIEIGSAPGVTTDTLEFENWREVEYELWQPTADGASRLTDYTFFKSKTDAGLSDATVSALETCLDDVFVKLTERAQDFYVKGDLPSGGDHNVLDGAALGRDNGNKIVVLTSQQALDLIGAKMQHKDGRTMSVLALDFVASPAQLDEAFTCGGETLINLTDRKQVLPHALDSSNTGGVAQGDFFITRLRWKAIEYSDTSWDWTRFPEAIAKDTDPGWAYRDWTDITDPGDIAAHIEIVNSTQIRFKVPAGKPSFPGQCFPVNSDQLALGNSRFQIRVQIQGVCVKIPLGQATSGLVILTTNGGTAHTAGIARIIAHELGHNMGQAYGDKTLDANLGRSNPIPGIPFPAVAPGGDIYTERGHRGLHCAKGLSNKAALTYDYPGVVNEHTCVMFGQANQASATIYKFCSDCTTYILAEDLSNIRKNWRA